MEEFSITYTKQSNNKEYEYIQKNEKVKKIDLKLYSDYDCMFYDFQNKFPNLSDISISIKFYNPNSPSHLKINENPYSKVNKIQLHIYNNNNVEINCQSYKTLESFKLLVNNKSNIKESIPIFNDKCDYIFESLKILEISFTNKKKNDKDELNNLYDNIDKNKIPNLRELNILSCFTQGIMFYKKFIGKMLSLKSIRKICIQRVLF